MLVNISPGVLYVEPGPPVAEVEKAKESAAKVDCPFVASTQKDNAGVSIQRPDFEMSPVKHSQTQSRMQGKSVYPV